MTMTNKEMKTKILNKINALFDIADNEQLQLDNYDLSLNLYSKENRTLIIKDERRYEYSPEYARQS